MNNKGMTLTELLVSIVMLTIASVLMYGLMSNIQKKRKDVDVRANDLIRILDIETRFQNEVMEPIDYGRDKVNFTYYGCNSDSNPSIVYIKFNGITFTVNVSGSTISLKKDTTTTATWTLSDSTCTILSDSCTKKDDTNHMYNIVVKCSGSKIDNYIKFPMYFKNT